LLFFPDKKVPQTLGALETFKGPNNGEQLHPVFGCNLLLLHVLAYPNSYPEMRLMSFISREPFEV